MRGSYQPVYRSTMGKGKALTPLLLAGAGFIFGTVVGCAPSQAQSDLEKQLEAAKANQANSKPAECHPAIQEPCYSGPEGSAGRGICKEGIRTCDANGFWEACDGAVMPAAMELCNDIDDDCNGKIDDGFNRAGSKCFNGSGTCQSEGVYRCSADGTTSECDAPAVKGTAEVCDGEDNDCDGEIDEGLAGGGEKCSTGKAGACNAGTKKCRGGEIRCVQNQPPSIEICNKIDDDCDNQVDEECVTEEQARKAGATK